MKNQALFSSKDKSKKLKCRLLQLLFSALRVNMKVCCVFSLETPHRGDSNEFTQYTIFNIKKKTTLNYPKSAAMGFCSKGLKNKFKIVIARYIVA